MGNHRHERPATFTEKVLSGIEHLIQVEVLVGIIHCLLTAAAVFGWVSTQGGH